MSKRLTLALCIFLPGAFGADSVLAQDLAMAPKAIGASKGAPQEPADDRRIRAIKISKTIKIDGRLDEAAWAEALPATDLRQQEPIEGSSASEKTEVRVLFDEKNLYIGIHAFDNQPERVNSRELVRAASFSNDDKVEILLDTFHDRRNAFRFTVNPLGTQQDALITDEGRDVNLSWDTSWVSSGQRDQTELTVEIAIPLTTLRFKEGEDVWGFNVARSIRRKNEEELWTSWQRSFGLEHPYELGITRQYHPAMMSNSTQLAVRNSLRD